MRRRRGLRVRLLFPLFIFLAMTLKEDPAPKPVVQLDIVVKESTPSEHEEKLPSDICQEAVLEVLRGLIRSEIAGTSYDERRVLQKKFLSQPRVPKYVFYEAAARLQEQHGPSLGSVPITVHSVNISTPGVTSLWETMIKQDFFKLCKNVSTIDPGEPRMLHVPIRVLDALCQDLPSKEEFQSVLRYTLHALKEDAKALASALGPMMLHYAAHGLGEKEVLFHPEPMIPHYDQIRSTAHMTVPVKPLDLNALAPLIYRSPDHQHFLWTEHLTFVHARILPIFPSRLKPSKHKFWNTLIDEAEFPARTRQTVSGSKTFRCATTWVRQGIAEWYYDGFAFRQALDTVCQVLLFLHVAPAEEKQFYVSQRSFVRRRKHNIEVRLYCRMTGSGINVK